MSDKPGTTPDPAGETLDEGGATLDEGKEKAPAKPAVPPPSKPAGT